MVDYGHGQPHAGNTEGFRDSYEVKKVWQLVFSNSKAVGIVYYALN